MHLPPWKYALIGVIDVYANYTTILAFKYTTITSVSLFDALAIPSAIIMSRFCVGRRYTKTRLLGVLVCSTGIVINVKHDWLQDKQLASGNGVNAEEELIEKDYPHKMAGDMLAIMGGILFGIDNTLQEVTVKDVPLLEYLGCMTFFASIISFIQAMILEMDEIMAFFGKGENETCSETEGIILFLLFMVMSMVNYKGISSFLQISDVAFFNLSLLTGDAWAVAFIVCGEGIKPPVSFYVALIITVSGVFIYETAPSPVDCETKENNEVIGELQLTEAANTGSRDVHGQDTHHVLT